MLLIMAAQQPCPRDSESREHASSLWADERPAERRQQEQGVSVPDLRMHRVSEPLRMHRFDDGRACTVNYLSLGLKRTTTLPIELFLDCGTVAR